MLSKLTKYLFLSIILLLSVVENIHAQTTETTNDDGKYVLIISSYAYEQEWNTNIAFQIRDHIEQQDSTVIVKISYMGAEKRKSFLATRYSLQSAFYTHPKRPDLLVLIGDEAWMTYRIMSLRSWQETPVLLCDVNEYILKDYTNFFENKLITDSLMIPINNSAPAINYTGIIRRDNTQQTIALMKKIIPELEQVVFVARDNYSDHYINKNIKKAINSKYPHINYKTIVDNGFNTDSIYRVLLDLSSKDAVLINQWYGTMTRSRKNDPALHEKLSALKVPFFSLVDLKPTDNLIVGGYYMPAEDYAHQANEMIFRLLKEGSTAHISMQHSDNAVMLNQSAIMHHGYKTNTIQHSVYFNSPPTFFIRNSKTIWSVTAGIVLLILGSIFYRRERIYQKEVRKSLRSYKSLYEEFMAVYENMPAGLILCNSKGKIIRINPEAKKIRDLLLAATCTQEVYSVSNLSFLPNDIQEMLEKKEPISQEIIYRIKQEDGEFLNYYFRISVEYIDDTLSGSKSTLIILVDTSETRREEIEREKMHNIFDFAMQQSEIGVAEYDLYTLQGHATEAWYKNLNIKPGSNFGNVYQNIIPEDREKIAQHIEKIKNGGTRFFSESIRVAHNNQIHWIRYLIAVRESDPHNNRIRLAELSLNIDAQKQREEDLKVALKKAKESELLKNGFITNMQQEIITPLDAIVSFAELICNTPDLEQKQELVKHVEENNEILLRVIGDIIDLSQIESDTVEFIYAETNLKVLVHEIAESIRYRVDASKIQVNVRETGNAHLIIIDGNRLAQVIRNFVSNAMRHTEKGYIEIGYEINADNMLYLYVKDSGSGISKNVQKNIFNSFIKDNNSTGNYGLGLPIAKSIIKRMGGEVGFESEQGKGSLFWCRLSVKTIMTAKKEQ